MAPKPTPQTWTLRFKYHQSTILLYVDPLQSITSIKSELLRALQQSHPDGKLNDAVIPQKLSDILLARQRDINDPSAGWESIELDKGGEVDAEDTGKGKGKASVTQSTGAKKSALHDTAQGAGLKDGGMVAFKFRTERDADRQEEEEDEDGIMLEDESTEQWDVVLPTWDDGYDDVMDQDER